MPTASNVSVAKPRVAGCVYRGKTTATAPTDASTAVSSSTFDNLGYVSDEGFTNNDSFNITEIKAFGGDVVCIDQSEHTDEWSFVLVESLNTDVQKAVYGDSNVSGTLSTGVTINSNNAALESRIWVIDTLQNGVLRRDVLHNARVKSRGEVLYKGANLIAYKITLGCIANASGVTHTTYLKTAST